MKPTPRTSTDTNDNGWPLRVIDLAIVSLLPAICLLLACHELIDADVWWHVRGGEWILEHRRPPGLDPFTFSSADRAWIDLHWLYEVILAMVFSMAGVPGTILLTASVAAAAVAIALAASGRAYSKPVVALCWLPALLMMGIRLGPRPEIFSLLYLAVFFAVLAHGRERPKLLWILPAAQVLWVNSQGLFILGPILFALFAAGEFVAAWRRKDFGRPVDAQWRRRLLLTGMAIALACLANPYGMRGAIFPIELFPKIAEPSNLYKTHINEFFSPLEFGQRTDFSLVERLVYFKVFYFLLLLVPVSFVFPALWRATQAAIAARRSKSVIGEWSQRTWLGAAVATVGILSFNAACLPGTSLPAPLRAIGAAAPLAVAALGVVGGVLLLRVSRPSAVLAGASGFALFMGMTSLQSTMFGSAVLAPAIHFPRGGFFLLCAIVFVLLVHLGADLFRLSVAAAFSYLALQAMRNLNLFGFVAGVLLSANANEWIMQMDAAPASFSLLSARWPRLGRAAVALVLAACLAFVPTTAFREWTGDTHRFGWNERPLAFPHDAAKFAGAPDLPTHALVYDLGLASVFLYHNCPPKKVFMDPRLEVPSTETFREYFVIDELLEAHDGRWAEYVKRLDVPLILLDHDQHSSSEMTMLSEDGWRCVYFDALAAAYVSDGSASATKYPSVDFGRRHFQENRHPSTPGGSQAEFYEAKALTRIASQFRQSTSATWHWRVPMLLHAVDRLDLAEQVADLPERLWTLRGQCYWNLVADLSIRPRSPAEGWSAPASILWAQSTWCLRQALIHDPQHVPALRSLYDSWRVRGMPDAQFAVGRQLEVMHSVSPRQHQELDELARMLSDLETGREMVGDQDVSSLISRGCVATAAQWLKAGKTDVGKWTWEHVDRLAAAWMHLGEPVEARNIWRSAEQAVSEPERLARIADTYLVERDFANAEELYRKSLEGNSRLAAAWWGLAMMFAQQGNAAALFDACEQGLSCELTPAERAELSELKSLAGRYR